MKISEDTMTILKNFSSINSNLVIFPGNELKSVAPNLGIISIATVSENFSEKVNIFDLSQFLNVCSMMKDPDFDFKDTHVIISSGKSKVKYRYAAPELMTTLENNLKRNMKPLTFEFNFELTPEMITGIMKSRSALMVSNMSIRSVGDRIVLAVHDKNDSSSNVYEVDLGDNQTKHEFSFNFDIVNSLKIIPGNYLVELSPKISKFTNKDIDVTYFISVESDSFWK